MWNGRIFVQHVAVEGLATAGGIQGTIADACVELLKWAGIHPVVKWVDDFVFFRSPTTSQPPQIAPMAPSFAYDLNTILRFTKPLGIPWHPISRKGQNFGPTFTYVGFMWDLTSCSVSSTSEKKQRVLSKLTTFLTNAPHKVKRRETASLHSSLQHLTFVYCHGRHSLLALSNFLAKFPNDFVSHHVPHAVLTQLSWWRETLTMPPACRSLVPLPLLDPDIWIDAASSWGIGLYIGGLWAAWELAPNWATSSQDIRWVEAIALEITVLWLAESSFHDACIKVNCDNTNVIDAFQKGRSRNAPRNDCIRRISIILAISNLSLLPNYVASALNKANSFSRGIPSDPSHRIPASIHLLPVLSSFLDRK